MQNGSFQTLSLVFISAKKQIRRTQFSLQQNRTSTWSKRHRRTRRLILMPGSPLIRPSIHVSVKPLFVTVLPGSENAEALCRITVKYMYEIKTFFEKSIFHCKELVRCMFTTVLHQLIFYQWELRRPTAVSKISAGDGSGLQTATLDTAALFYCWAMCTEHGLMLCWWERLCLDGPSPPKYSSSSKMCCERNRTLVKYSNQFPALSFFCCVFMWSFRCSHTCFMGAVGENTGHHFSVAVLLSGLWSLLAQ